MRRTLAMTVILALFIPILASASFAGEPKNIMTMVATDDVNKAAMAIKFTHAAMKNKGLNATVFFNVYGVHLVDINHPSAIYATGESITEMLQAFMQDGGKVLACPMCMKNVGGMTDEDLMEGVVAQKGGGLNAATQADTLVLNY